MRAYVHVNMNSCAAPAGHRSRRASIPRAGWRLRPYRAPSTTHAYVQACVRACVRACVHARECAWMRANVYVRGGDLPDCGLRVER